MRPVPKRLSTLSRPLKVVGSAEVPILVLTIILLVIARNALAQEESEEFSGDFSDPIDIHLDRESDGCAC